MEGPDIVLLKEKIKDFKGKKILHARGYATLDHKKILHRKVVAIKTWGKQLLLCLGESRTLKIHFGLFGIYRINDPKKEVDASLSLRFTNGRFDCYIAHPKLIEKNLDEIYDWRLDQFSGKYSLKKVKHVLVQQPKEKQIGDLLLNPDIFAGVGNIIRNESLYRAKLHPESKLGSIPSGILTALVRQTHDYSKAYLEASRKKELRKTWKVYNQTKCPCGHKIKKKRTGKTKRNSFICDRCMIRYS
jgi:endonuclease-8